MKGEFLSIETANKLASYNILEERILNETTSCCDRCIMKECCIEEECEIYRIEKILTGEE